MHHSRNAGTLHGSHDMEMGSENERLENCIKTQIILFCSEVTQQTWRGIDRAASIFGRCSVPLL